MIISYKSDENLFLSFNFILWGILPGLLNNHDQ